MTLMDYEKLGFKCGIEIHQQIAGRKLFCSCPAITITKKEGPPDFTLKRYLRAAAGETGEVDIAAKYEQEKSRQFIYQGYDDCVCLVETDSEPPHPPNPEAIQTALQIAKMLNAKIVDQIQVMRKTVVDGSNVSGFQRTMLIATDGYIETSQGKVGIPIICLEEEAAKRIKTEKDSVIFRLDRLGVPLVEVGTDSSIKSPEHAKEVAEKLGMILRSTGKVKRGIGTIRQDVNISIKGGARTEIKGFQDLKSMPKVIGYEIKRQQKLIEEGRKVEKEVRKAEPDGTTSFLRPMPGAARMYPETDVEAITPGKVEIEEVELIEDRIEALKKYKIEEGVAKQIVREEKDKWYLKQIKKNPNVKPAFIVQTAMLAVPQVKKEFNIDINPTKEDYELLFKELSDGKISKDSILVILKENKPVREIVSKFELMPDKDLEKEIKEIIKENKNIPPNALIGRAMAKLKGKAEGKKIVEIVKKLS